MKKLNIAIIGLGSILPMHITSILHQKDAVLCGVCDIKSERAEKYAKKYNTAAYTDYKKMIDELKPDAVHILTPHYLHSEMTVYCLKNGVNVLCEKPMSIDVKEAERNVAFAKEKNLKFGVIFQCRYNTASQLVKKHIDNGNLGRVIAARSVLTWYRADSYYKASDWKGTWDKEGGGVVIDQAIHSIDLVNWLISDTPVSVSADINNRSHKIIEVEDSAEGLIKYKNGAVYGFWAMNNYAVDEPIEIRLYCEKGRASLSYEKAVIEFNNGEILSVTQQIDEDINYEGGKDYWGFQHIKQIRQFYDSLQGIAPLEITGEQALITQKIVSAIYQSAKEGKEIKL